RVQILCEAGALERVGTDVHGVVHAHLAFDIAIEGRAGQAEHHDHHADVHDIAAVAASVAAGEQPCGFEQVTARLACDDLRAAHKFAQHRDEHAHSDAEGHQRIEVAGGKRAVDPGVH